MSANRPRLSIELFGDLGVYDQSGASLTFSGDRPVSLLAYLLLNRGKSVLRRHLAFQLWPDSTEGQARTNLRNLLFTLRQCIPGVDAFLRTSATELTWRSEGDYELDVARFERALQAARKTESLADRIRYLDTAVSLRKGELLSGNYDDWVVPVREQLRQSYLAALRQLALAQEQSGDLRLAIVSVQRLLQQDPLDESITVELMRLHAALGDRSGVRRCYEQCALVLRKELDVDPAEATNAALAKYLAAGGSAPAKTAPVAAEVAERAALRNLPVPVTPFVGREAELEACEARLSDPACRLLSIVGLGGIGKTRLAIQTASRLGGAFSDGVAYVSLTPLASSDLLPAALSEALQLVLSGPKDALAQVIDFLRGKRLLLVLDNFEHLLGMEEDSAESLISSVLQEAPGVKILATTRQRLGLQEEWVFELDGLPLPTLDSEGSFLTSSAVVLFVQSARRAANAFEATEEDLRRITRICALVDGMPLGIELAATWTRVLSCAEIVDEIGRDLQFLSASVRNVPERHRSMQAVFAHSWRLLTSVEQVALARLSRFRGGFSRDAAIAVAGASLKDLAGLVDKSFVRRGREGRYNVHELVRQFAASKLAEDATLETETAEAHGLYFIGRLGELTLITGTGRQSEVRAAIHADLDNIRLAWDWAIDRERFREIAKVGLVFWHFSELNGYYQEGLARFENLEKRAQARLLDCPAEQRAAALHAFGVGRIHRVFFAFRLGRVRESVADLQDAVEVLRAVGSEPELIDALWTYAVICWLLGRPAVAAECLRESLDIAEKLERTWNIAVHGQFLGIMLHELGELESARYYLTRSLAQSRALGDPRAISFVVCFLSRTERELGGKVNMIEPLRESLQLVTETHDRFAMGLCFEFLSIGYADLEDRTAALSHIDQGINLYVDVGDTWSLARSLTIKGAFLLNWGNLAEAEALFLQAAQAARDSETEPPALDALTGLARIRMERGDYELAGRWAAVVLAHEVTSLPTRAAAAEIAETARLRASAVADGSFLPTRSSETLCAVLRELLA